MKLLRLVLLLVHAITFHSVPAVAQDNKPDEVAQVGKALFAYFQKTDTTQVLIKVGVIYDNTKPDFPAFKGGQTINLFLMYDFKGRRLKESPDYFTLAFGSIAGLPARYSRPEERGFQLTVDGVEAYRAEAALKANIPTPYVTYEDLAVNIPSKAVDKMLAPEAVIVLTLGRKPFLLNYQQKTDVREFVAALRLMVGQPIPFIGAN